MRSSCANAMRGRTRRYNSGGQGSNPEAVGSRGGGTRKRVLLGLLGFRGLEVFGFSSVSFGRVYNKKCTQGVE